MAPLPPQAFLRSVPGVDVQRVGVWGTSQGGGHVLGFSGAEGAKVVAAVVAFLSEMEVREGMEGE